VNSGEDILDSRTGWVYCLVHPQYPDVLKIGFTERSVTQRITELERGTGTLPGYVCVFAVNCFEPYLLEQGIHKRLARYRVWAGKEFFQVELRDAERAARIVIADIGIKVLQFYCPHAAPEVQTPEYPEEIPGWLKGFDRMAAERAIAAGNPVSRRPSPEHRRNAYFEFAIGVVKFLVIIAVIWGLIFLVG
jgi:T5orf172 domain